jgi:hypothetical protein
MFANVWLETEVLEEVQGICKVQLAMTSAR